MYYFNKLNSLTFLYKWWTVSEKQITENKKLRMGMFGSTLDTSNIESSTSKGGVIQVTMMDFYYHRLISTFNNCFQDQNINYINRKGGTSQFKTACFEKSKTTKNHFWDLLVHLFGK